MSRHGHFVGCGRCSSVARVSSDCIFSGDKYRWRTRAVIDFSQLQMEQDARKSRQTGQDRRRRQQLIDSGALGMRRPDPPCDDLGTTPKGSATHRRRVDDGEYASSSDRNSVPRCMSQSGLSVQQECSSNDWQNKIGCTIAAICRAQKETPVSKLSAHPLRPIAHPIVQSLK